MSEILIRRITMGKLPRIWMPIHYYPAHYMPIHYSFNSKVNKKAWGLRKLMKLQNSSVVRLIFELYGVYCFWLVLNLNEWIRNFTNFLDAEKSGNKTIIKNWKCIKNRGFILIPEKGQRLTWYYVLVICDILLLLFG